jgi:Terminase large subunit, T4likevirus-type, N-terminal
MPRGYNAEKVAPTIVWEPQPGPQTSLLSCPIFEVLFGGARGGGKTDAMLGDFASHAAEFGEYAIGLCVRRERTQLMEMIERSKQMYAPLGARFKEQDKMWRFKGGGRLTFAYLENDADAEAYQGHSYSRVYVEEMGNFPRPEPILKLMATLRSPVASVRVGFRATANPGGPGHLWIRQRYIDPAPKGMTVLYDRYKNPFTNEETPIERVYIPSRVTDNKYCNTGQYIAQLQLSAGKRLLHAWLYGDWSIIEGAFFEEWDENKHIIRPFIIPEHWTRFVSADWGSAHPFSIGWWAVVPGDEASMDSPLKITSGRQVFSGREYKGGLPAGAIVRYREWYGSANHNNTGLKLHAEEVAAGIVERERYEPRYDSGRARIAYRVIDPDACKDKGGPTISERMGAAPNYVFWSPADNSRVGKRGALGGWDAVRGRLKGKPIGGKNSDGSPCYVPMLYVFDTCVDTIRCLPVAQHDPDNPEDIMECEDHVLDDIRYGCMSRPFISQRETKGPDRFFAVGPGNQLTIDDVMGDHEHSNKARPRYERMR